MAQFKLYLALAVLIAFLGLGATALWYRGQAISATAEAARAQADLATAVGVNKANQETIGRLKAQSETNDRITAELAQKLADSNAALRDSGAARTELKDSNDQVRDYLNAPVPDALRRMYDH